MSEILLEEITKNTLEFFKNNNIKIIIPKLYEQKFLFFLKKKDKELNIDEAFNKDVNIINKMYTLITKNLNESKTNTQEAIKAIKENNVSNLNSIVLKMELLLDKMNQLEKELYIDSLTDIHNRKWLFDKYLINRKFPVKGILGFIDLNNFKGINDNYGHIVGDKVLTHMVKFIKEELENAKLKNWKLIRYAGDEFLLIFEEQLMIDIKPLMDKIQKKYSKQTLKVRNHNFNSSFSIGFSGFLKNNLFDNIIEKADKNMYLNKKVIKRKIKEKK